MNQIKLKAAKELLQEKKYDAARSVLETIPDDPIAQKWLKKLDVIAPQHTHSRPSKRLKISSQEFPDPYIPDLPIKNTRSHKKQSKLKTILGVVVFIAVLASCIALFLRQQNISRLESRRPEAFAVLSTFCDLRIRGMDMVACDQWARRTLNEDISKVDDVLMCDRLWNRESAALVDDTNARLFIDCLANDGIYLPAF